MVRTRRNDACSDVPVRTCVGCRKRAAKQELLRVVAGGSDHDRAGLVLVPDPRGTAPGRGAYVHPEVECLDLALRRRAFTRALRVEARLADAPLRDYLQQDTNQLTDRRWSSSS